MRQLLVVYSRRRIGNTILSLNFLQNKPDIYFLCIKDSGQEDLI
ncbi:MAG: hypothetical protein U9N46_10140 [Euryarchaeota archaeon]|nr:hypothetical protein [Euryarchaeota archaeon]